MLLKGKSGVYDGDDDEEFDMDDDIEEDDDDIKYNTQSDFDDDDDGSQLYSFKNIEDEL